MFDEIIIGIMDFFQVIGFLILILFMSIIDTIMSVILFFTTTIFDPVMLKTTGVEQLYQSVIDFGKIFLVFAAVISIIIIILTKKGEQIISVLSSTAFAFFGLFCYIGLFAFLLSITGDIIATVLPEGSSYGAGIVSNYINYNEDIYEYYTKEEVEQILDDNDFINPITELENGSINIGESRDWVVRIDPENQKLYSSLSFENDENGNGIFNENIEPEYISIYNIHWFMALLSTIICLFGFLLVAVNIVTDLLSILMVGVIGIISIAFSPIDKGTMAKQWIMESVRMMIKIPLTFVSISLGFTVVGLINEELYLSDENIFFVLFANAVMILGLIFFILDGPQILEKIFNFKPGQTSGSGGKALDVLVSSGMDKSTTAVQSGSEIIRGLAGKNDQVNFENILQLQSTSSCLNDEQQLSLSSSNNNSTQVDNISNRKENKQNNGFEKNNVNGANKNEEMFSHDEDKSFSIGKKQTGYLNKSASKMENDFLFKNQYSNSNVSEQEQFISSNNSRHDNLESESSKTSVQDLLENSGDNTLISSDDQIDNSHNDERLSSDLNSLEYFDLQMMIHENKDDDDLYPENS